MDKLPDPNEKMPDWYINGEKMFLKYKYNIESKNERELFKNRNTYTSKVLRVWAERVQLQLKYK